MKSPSRNPSNRQPWSGALVIRQCRSSQSVRTPQPERARGAGRGGGADLAHGSARDDHHRVHGSGTGRNVRAMTPRAYLRGPLFSDQVRRVLPGSSAQVSSQSPPRPSRNSRAARFEPSTCKDACRPCSATIARPRSGSERRSRQMTPTNRHSSRKRRQPESSQPSGISPTGLRSPRTNARHAHLHQGVSRSTTVSARASRSSSVWRSLPSMIQASPASRVRCVSRHASSDGLTQPGFQ